MTILQTAHEWLTIGVSPIPIRKDGTKAPAQPWRHFQNERPTPENLAMWFATDDCGLGVCTGRVEMLEFEGHAFTGPDEIYGRFRERLSVTNAPNGRGTMLDVWDRIRHGYSEASPRGGIHVFYEIPNTVQRGNAPLARRLAHESELNEGEVLGRAFRVQVETRGKGGQVVVAPSGPDVSLRDVGWRILDGRPDAIVKVTIAERDKLWEVVRSLGTYTPPKLRGRTRTVSVAEASWAADRSWDSILEPQGWLLAQVTEGEDVDGEVTEGIEYWRHPSAHSGWSATVGAGSGNVADCLYVFSTSTDFEAGFFYTKMEAIALFEHDGDVSAAREEAGIRHLPEDFFEKEEGVQIARLAAAVLEDGPLAAGHDHRLWQYKDGVWIDGDREFTRRMTTLLENRYRTTHESHVRAYLLATLDRITCEAVCSLCKDRPPDSDEFHINFKDVVVDWQTGEVLPHNPSFMFTTQLQTNYNPNALCPAFDAFVESVMPEDATELFWQFIGYLLLNGNPLQRTFLLLGKGGNGKGVTERLIKKLVGSNNISNVTLDQLNENRFAAADMFGKSINWAGDIDATFQKKTANIKAITGDGSFRAERKNKDGFSFTPYATPVFSGNKIPPSADTTHGYGRRWEVLWYPNEFDAASDPDLESRIGGELEGIAARAIVALRNLMEVRDFVKPVSAKVAKLKFVEASDHVRRFIKECCNDERHELAVLMKDQPHRRSIGTEPTLIHLYGSVYRQWVEAEQCQRLGRNTFYERVRDLGFSDFPTDGKTVFGGLTLKSGITGFGTFGPSM